MSAVEHNTDYNYLRIKKSNWESYCDCLEKIKSHIKKKEPIPSKLFSEYESLINTVQTDKRSYYSAKQDSRLKSILEYFKKYPKYHFECKKHKGVEDIYATFNDMIWVITFWQSMKLSYDIKNTYSDRTLKSKLVEIIKQIRFYIADLPVKYSDRQIYIIAGQIVMAFDYPLINNKEMTNSNIFYAVRNAIKYKSKKPAA